MAEVKSFSGGVEIKSESKGEVSAVFSTFNVIDSDNDVTFPGAFTDGEEVVISGYGHSIWKGDPPVGEGTIRSTRTEAILDGRFFMDTTAGREMFATVKAMKGRQRWSYGYDVLHKPETVTFQGRKANALRKLKVYEVSPVFRSAGVNTRTLAVKSAIETLLDGGMDGGMDPQEAARLLKETPLVSEYKAAIRPHETGFRRKAWNPADLGDVLTKASVDDLRALHAWVNPLGDPTVKSSYEFLHHHGPGGDANVRACLLGVAQLKRAAATDPQIPEGDRGAVYAHLAQHLADADYDVPEMFDPSIKMNDRLTLIAADLTSAIAEVDEVGASRALKGKATQTARTLENLDWLRELSRDIDLRLNSPQETAAEEFARFVLQNLDNLGESA
jgi:hypothetical protein